LANTVNDNVGLQPASDELGNVINVPVPTDLWWDVKHLPLIGSMRIGNMKEPIGLEHLTSSRFLDFMERSFNQDAFTGPFNNGFTPGIMLHKLTDNERATISLGVFKNTTNIFAFDAGDGEYAVTGRVSGLPWYDEPSQGRYLLHLGLAGSHRDPDAGQVRIRSRASLRNGPGALNPVLADTGSFFADSQDLVGGEAALVCGPWLLQGEYIASLADGANIGGVDRGTPYFYGYYAEVMYFLTGEHRAYDHDRGAFGRVIPYSNAFLVRTADGAGFGPGAWQVGLRYSQLDLNDGGIQGGVIEDVTLGLNWFLNPNMKLQWNYVHTRRDALAAAGDIYGFGMRLAMDF
jgi:phosphate-selective porin OprO/OprP